MYEQFYQRFKIITHRQFWRKYLHTCYSDCIDDLKAIHYTPDFNKNGFRALLCGTSGEITSDVFTEFVLAKNEQAHILIIDLGHLQIKKSRELLAKKFPGAGISYVIADARKLPVASSAVDFIETDTLLNFFNSPDMGKVIKEWHDILTPSGFVTTRILANHNRIRRYYDEFLFALGKLVIGASYKTHSVHTIALNIKKAGFEFINGGHSSFAQQKRFSMIKNPVKKAQEKNAA